MKNQIYLITACILAASTPLVAQTNQLKKWFIAPKEVEMPFGTSPSVLPLPTVNGVAPAQTMEVANGIYDDNNNLLFYVSDNSVYDYNNSLIGTITPTGEGAEIIIVPFGNNNSCQSKFNIFTTSGGFTGNISLHQSILDMKSFSLTTNIQPPIDVMPIVQEFGAIAVGPVIFGTQGDRYMYFMGGSGTPGAPDGRIHKLLIQNNGTIVAQGLLYPSIPYQNAGAEIFSRELELSPDGKYLAWASLAPANSIPTQYRYHFLELDLSGNYVNSSYQQFNIPGITGNNVSGFRGVEFYQSGAATKLFMGAGTNGIYGITIPLVNSPPLLTDFTFVTNSDVLNFGLSQIEHSFNGYMFAASGNSSTGNVGAFDPISLNPSINTFQSFTLNNPLPPNSGYSSAALYTLPDQIDGQNYDDIVPVAVPPVVTASSHHISSGGSVTWTYGSGTSNPWSTSAPVHILQELRISQNTKLTIDNMTFKFSPGAKVIVENGSSLTLDNGTVFTSNHDTECNDNYSWIGVEVWGSPTNQSQNPSNPPLVGKLTLKNGSKIEYAQWGARAQRPDGFITHRGGIIVSESGSMFVNNKMDVEFLPYQNINNGTTYGNKSYFSNTTFTNDDEFLYIFTGAPIHVSIEDNRGIRFINCNFYNHDSYTMFQKVSIGIKSINSYFSVSNSSTFSNLFRAIHAYRSSGAQTFSVTNSTFTDNEVAIYNNNVNKIQVHQNTFFIGGHQRSSGTFQYGIRNWYGTGFSIQENLFKLSLTPVGTANKIGILITESGTAANQIYKNTFDELTYGNYSTGQNCANSQTRNIQGLQWLCNKNINNTVNNFYATGVGVNSGVRRFQGTGTNPAGNEFTTSGSNSSHFNNNTSAVVSYYYNPTGSQQTPLYYNSPQVVPVSTGSYVNTCPTLLCIPACERVSISHEELTQLYAEYDTIENEYLNMLYTYNQLMDGGNTNALLNEIQLNWSADANAMFNELMELSPFLSQDILREVAMGDVLPHAMMLTVCMANPDATRDDEFLYFLLTEIPNPFYQYMIDLIVSSWNDETARTTIENMIADHNSDLGYISDKILIDLYFKQSLEIDEINPEDTTNYFEQINFWLNRTQNLEARYEQVENLFISGDIASCEVILESIPVDFELSDEQQIAHENYLFFYEFRKDLFASGYNLSELDSNQINLLFNYTQGNQNFAIGMIQNVLCFYFDICRDDNLEESENRFMHQSNAPVSVNLKSSETLSTMLTISPNPANDLITVRYKIPNNLFRSQVVICDVIGKEIKRITLFDTQGQVQIDISSLNKGVYYYHLENIYGITNKGKISIIK